MLWIHDRPAAGGSTPTTYELSAGNIVIAATGGRVSEEVIPYITGDTFIAFTLPDNQ